MSKSEPVARKFRETDATDAYRVLEKGVQDQAQDAYSDPVKRKKFTDDAIGTHWNPDLQRFKDPNNLWVAEIDGQVVGLMCIMGGPGDLAKYAPQGELFIRELDAFPKQTGAGSKLIEVAIAEARDRQRTCIWLWVVLDSPAHRKFYPKHHFKEDNKYSVSKPYVAMKLDLEDALAAGETD